MKRKILFLIFSFLGHSLSAEIEMPQIFSDNMILQQNQEIPVWGWSEPGDKIRVQFQSQNIESIANEMGKWMVRMSSVEATYEPQSMTIQNESESIEIKNILIGEVWLCSGQSNMAYTMQASSKKPRNPEFTPITDSIKNEIITAQDPYLRQIHIPNNNSISEKKKNFDASWLESSPKTNPAFTATGYYFAKELRRELKVPVGLIKCAWGGTRVQPWIPSEGYLENETFSQYYHTEIKKAQEEQSKLDPQKMVAFNKQIEAEKDPIKKKQWIKKRPKAPIRSNRLPTTIFNGMVHPIIPYAIKGTLWYQGEANRSHLPEQYKDYLTTLISSWRALWGQGDFPFYIAQLANFQTVNRQPVEEDLWATVCNQQRLTLELKNTGLAVLNDIGEAEDIHPRNKIDVGKRLSLWALAKAYNQKDLVYSGPLYKESKFNGQNVVIHFDSVGSGLMVGKRYLHQKTVPIQSEVQGFQICGKDRQWKWAQAILSSKNTVTVFHPEVQEPIEVRYAWSSNPPEINLYNKEGLPTSIFSTKTTQ